MDCSSCGLPWQARWSLHKQELHSLAFLCHGWNRWGVNFMSIAITCCCVFKKKKNDYMQFNLYLLKESVSLFIWTLATMKLSRVILLVFWSYFSNKFWKPRYHCLNIHVNKNVTWTKVGLNLYPIWVRACVNSPSSINPLRSLSMASNIPFHWLM